MTDTVTLRDLRKWKELVEFTHKDPGRSLVFFLPWRVIKRLRRFGLRWYQRGHRGTND